MRIRTAFKYGVLTGIITVPLAFVIAAFLLEPSTATQSPSLVGGYCPMNETVIFP